MIVPPRDANGAPDLESLRDWNVGCDSADCDAQAPLGDCSEWCIGLDSGLQVYCPHCEWRISRDLIRSVFPSRSRLGTTLRLLRRLWRGVR